MMTVNELKAALTQFTGSEEFYYHPLFRKFHYTEGVRFVAQEAEAYWLLEKILSNQILPELRNEHFQSWKLTVESDKSALLVCEDGNYVKIYSEKIDYTDFPLEEISFFFTNSVLLLPSEY
ncbi:MAG: hypothetical protein PHX61_06735 [Alphaproteobacteria bacterium]|nr:hypothetical protein [Alphaproteobacteria bacterium]